MKLMPHHLLAAAVLAALSTPAFAETSFDVIGGSEISFEGMLQGDYNKFNDDIAILNGSTGDGLSSDSELRRAELVFKGKGPGMWTWVAGYDAKAKKFLDLNIGYRFSGFTTLTVGQFKQPNSFEELSSTKNNDFVSKAMTTNLQGVARRVGVGLTTGGDQWSLTGSAFTREMTRNLGEGNGYGARFTWLPINDAENGNFLHLGVSLVDYAAKDPSGDGREQFRVRPDADLSGKRLVDAGLFTDGNRIRTAGVEGMWASGPFKLQSEYMRTNASRDLHANYSFSSWYVSGVWNMTGEKFGYKNGVVTTGLPDDPASGMWQLAVRYDSADLNDGTLTYSGVTPVVTGVLGGKENNWTVGVNYYWRSNFKFALNYVMVNSSRYVGKTSATYSSDPAWNNRTVNGILKDNPNILEFRAQIYW